MENFWKQVVSSVPTIGMKKIETNYIFLDGYICKAPVYRKTPLGREIADLLLAVNRPYGKSDYIPCICWGRNARFADTFQVGEHIQIWGRIQSREYQKKLDEEVFETRVAYEISVSKLEHIEEMSAIVAASEETVDEPESVDEAPSDSEWS